MKVKEIVTICNAELLSGDKEETIENIKKDTHDIEKGDTYVGIQGEKVNRKYFL